jgi:hypothetical protein
LRKALIGSRRTWTSLTQIVLSLSEHHMVGDYKVSK